jgi:hypothetical protein
MTPQAFIEKMAAARAPKLSREQYETLAKNAPMSHRRGTTTRLHGTEQGNAHGSSIAGLVTDHDPLLSLARGALGLNSASKPQRTITETQQRMRTAGGGALGTLAGGVAGSRMPAKNRMGQARNKLIGGILGGLAGAAIAHGKRLPNHDEARAALKNKKKSGQIKTAEETKQERRARIVKGMKRAAGPGARIGAVLGLKGSVLARNPWAIVKDVEHAMKLKPSGFRSLALHHGLPTAAGAALGGASTAAYSGIRAARNKDKNYYTGEREKLAGRKASAIIGALGTGGSVLSGAGAEDGKGMQTSMGSYAGRELGRVAGRAFFKGKGKKPRSAAIVGDTIGGTLGGAAGAYLAHGKNRTAEQEQKRKDEIVKQQAKRLPSSVLAKGKGNRKLMRQFNEENRARLAKKACINPQVDNILDNLEKEAFLGAAIKGAKGLLTSKAVRKPLSGLARKVGPGGRSMVRSAVSSATKNPIRTAAGAGAALGAVRGAVKNPGTNPDGTKKSRLAAIAKNTAGGAALGAGAGYGASKLK